ncbi:MAG: acyltransferase [Actinobacteria bacterium]|nr:acyltransferase [Actinomycetota bacterium]
MVSGMRRDIEGLRAVAVGVVVLYHAHFLGLQGGFVGVDVFFVVSGFLITSLLLREHAASGRVSLTRFYGRRVRRLLPASCLVIVGTVVAGNIWLEPLRLRDLGTDAVASGGFVANIVFAQRGTDYLQSTLPPSALQHYWSLAVEEQFYVVWPALLALLLWKGTRSTARAAIGITALSIASFIVCIWQTSASQPWAFFGLHARAWELGAGALLAIAWPRIVAVSPRARGLVGWVGMATIIAACFAISEAMAFPGFLALAPVVGTMLVLVAGDDATHGPVMILRNPVMQWIGARSYSIYLWHWPALIVGESALDGPLSAAERVVLVAGSVVVADLSFRFIENPVRHSRPLATRNNLALGIGAGLVVVSIGAGLVLRNKSIDLSTDVVATTPTFVTSTSTPVETTQVATESTVSESTSTVVDATTTVPAGPPPPVVSPTEPLTAIVEGVATEKVPKNLEPSLVGATGDKPIIYDDGCHLDASSTEPGECVFGDTTSSFTVALFGDSHAAQWFDALDAIAQQRGWRLLSLTKLGCTPIEQITYNSTVGATYPQCAPWRANVKKRLAAEKAAVVFISYSNRLQQVGVRQPFPDQVWLDGFKKLIPELRDIGTEPILITDTPYPGRDVPICLSANVSSARNCAFSRETGIRQSRLDTNIAAAVDNGAQVLDVTNWMCTDKACPVIVGNLLVYRDSNHITTKYAEWLTPLIDAAVTPYVEGVRQRTRVS